MPYFEQARTIDTVPERMALPERSSLVCEGCGSRRVTICRDVVVCECGERWTWCPLVGMD